MENEKRLIDLDKIKPMDFPSYEMDGLDVVQYLNTLPTVDAVEVVRCRDCVYWENGKDYTPFCNRPEYGFHECPKPDDFCSYGERKLND